MDFWQQSFKEGDDWDAMWDIWDTPCQCTVLTLVSNPERGTTRWKRGLCGCFTGRDKMGNVSCLSTSQFRQPLSLNHCHFRWAPLDLTAGFTGARWLQTGGADRYSDRSRADADDYIKRLALDREDSFIHNINSLGYIGLCHISHSACVEWQEEMLIGSFIWDILLKPSICYWEENSL